MQIKWNVLTFITLKFNLCYNQVHVARLRLFCWFHLYY